MKIPERSKKKKKKKHSTSNHTHTNTDELKNRKEALTTIQKRPLKFEKRQREREMHIRYELHNVEHETAGNF